MVCLASYYSRCRSSADCEGVDRTRVSADAGDKTSSHYGNYTQRVERIRRFLLHIFISRERIAAEILISASFSNV